MKKPSLRWTRWEGENPTLAISSLQCRVYTLLLSHAVTEGLGVVLSEHLRHLRLYDRAGDIIFYIYPVTSAEFTKAILDLRFFNLYKVQITRLYHQVTSAEFTQAILGDDKFSRLLAVSVMQMFV